MTTVEKTAAAFGKGLFFLAGITVFVCLSTVFGAISGWIVGLIFSETILGIASQIGIKDVQMWQLGAFFGFIGGFLKTKVSHGEVGDTP